MTDAQANVNCQNLRRFPLVFQLQVIVVIIIIINNVSYRRHMSAA